jgi:hypothetical protein
VVLCTSLKIILSFLHDEAQGFLWKHAQAIIHPFVISLKKPDALNTELERI